MSCSAAWAQQGPPTVSATRIDVAEAPTIDGDLSDLAWTRASVLDELLQVEPNTGAPGTERTVVRIMYDENNLYFGVYAYDSEPDLIVMRSMARDGEIFTGDNVSFLLDPGPTRRNAYSFQVWSLRRTQRLTHLKQFKRSWMRGIPFGLSERALSPTVGSLKLQYPLKVFLTKLEGLIGASILIAELDARTKTSNGRCRIRHCNSPMSRKQERSPGLGI